MRAVSFAEVAERLLDNGYDPLPIVPGGKAPIPKQWSTLPVDLAQVEVWARAHPHAGVGLRTGHLVGIDIDIDDPDLANQAALLVEARLGVALFRVGRWPRRLYLARTERPFAKIARCSVEILALGQQLVAFGIHEGTGRPYDWPLGQSPLDTPYENLPLIDKEACRDLIDAVARLHPGAEPPQGRRRAAGGKPKAQGPTRDSAGRVIDGRDSQLSAIAFRAVHDAVEAGGPIDAARVAEVVWRQFEKTTDLTRPRKDGPAPYRPADAARKVEDKFRLLNDGRLPPRAAEAVEPPSLPELLPVEEARRNSTRRLAILPSLCWDGTWPDRRARRRKSPSMPPSGSARPAPPAGN